MAELAPDVSANPCAPAARVSDLVSVGGDLAAKVLVVAPGAAVPNATGVADRRLRKKARNSLPFLPVVASALSSHGVRAETRA